ncbi:MAG TPA: TetR/AcrR family transcriptional regulator [Caulobacter sp.]|nr:TetR/AcrR family transcriptional regulator [Caulobacter sp.]
MGSTSDALELTPAGGRRRPKGDKRARTRARLLEAARDLVREKGYEQVTLQDVARRAGMTSGAIYGNFRNRADLFVTLGETYWAPVRPLFHPDMTFAERMQALAEATIAAIPDRQEAVVGRLTGMAHALTDEELRRRVLAVTTASFGAGSAWLREAAQGVDLPMPPDQLVVVIHAMTEGLLFQRFLTPELVSDDVFRAAFAALAGTPPLPA